VRTETDRGFEAVERWVGFEVTRVALMTEFVRRGLGVAVLPESVALVQALSGGFGTDQRRTAAAAGTAGVSQGTRTVCCTASIRGDG
jgi:DNA-binding transcriptional LysR family regulator